MSWESPIDAFIDDVQYTFEDNIVKAIQNVNIKVDKEELLKALEYDRGQYEKGEWDMFELITSAYYGKQYYFLEPSGVVYSRESGKYIKRDEAYREFLRMTEGKNERTDEH